jgi:hypothetical protein
MTPKMNDVLDRFHQTLVEEITARRPEFAQEPFTVAEIYQNLVPYGTHRDRLGVEMNADYEDALLRILAGEGGYLLLESEAALRALREELDSSNPNTGIYREYAAVEVRLNPARAGERKAPSPAPAEPPVVVEARAPAADLVTAQDLEPVAQPVVAKDPVAESRQAGTPDTCLWCRADLPDRPNLRFCPFCGTDVRLVPCPTCREELEPEWRFCIACGTEVAS